MASAQSQSSEFNTGIPSQKLWGQSKPKRPPSSSSVREEEKLRFCYGSGSVSTLVSLFAAAFATQNTSQMFAPRRRYSAAKATVSRVTDARNGEERILRASVCELHAARITSPTSSRRSTSRICSLRFKDRAASSVIGSSRRYPAGCRPSSLSSTLGIEEKGIRRSVRFIEVWPAWPWLGLTGPLQR